MAQVSLSMFRAKLFQFFDLMKETGVTIKIYHRRKVYDVTITPTRDKIEKAYVPRPAGRKKGVKVINHKPCPKCGELMVGTVCMSGKH